MKHQRGMSLGFACVLNFYLSLAQARPGWTRGKSPLDHSRGSVSGPPLSAPRWGYGAADDSWLSTWGEGDGGVGMVGKAVTSPQEVLHFVGRENVGVFS